MNFKLSFHAQEQLATRALPLYLVEMVLENPQQIVESEVMKAHYDSEVDALAINWGNNSIAESDEVEPGVILDYDAQGNVVGIEILNASKKVKNLGKIATATSKS